MVHKLISHKSLALKYNSKEELLNHAELKKFIDWVKNQTKKVK
jgi:hypothetical protein